MSGLRGKVLTYAAGNIVAQFASTLTGIYLARTLDLHDLGSYKQVILVVTVSVQVLALGLPLSIFYFLPRIAQQPERTRFAGQTLLLLSALGIMATGLTIALAPFLANRFDNPELVGILRLGAPLAFTGLAAKYVPPVFLSLDRSRLAGILRVVQTLSVTVVLVVMVALGLPLAYALLGMALAEGLSVLIALRLQTRDLPIRLAIDRELLRQQLRYALPLGMSSVVGLLSRQIDQFMVADYFDAPTYALYAMGALEFPLVPLLVTSAAGVLLPRLSQLFGDHDLDGYCKLFSQAQWQLAVAVFAVLGLAFAMGETLMVGVYGEAFERSTWVFRIYVLSSLNRMFLFGVLLQSTGRSRLVLIGESILLVINAVANWFFLRWMGFLGPAVATYLAGVLVMAFYTWQIHRTEGLSPRQLYSLGRNVRILVACAAASAGSWWIAAMLPRSFAMLVLGSGAYVLLLLPLLLATRALRRSELTILLPWKRRGAL